MKFNKWTVGLAAVGVISLASAARADEKMNALQTALSNTTISGYVSASANWAIEPGGAQNQRSPAAFIPFQPISKQDGFNLDVVKLSIAKPQDESPWASGYQVDLLFGPDAVGYNVPANGYSYDGFAIKQAYVVLRTPVGNGIDWKIGVFDSPIGYEVFDAGSNPNYTRSWGYAIEPTEFTGVLGTYKINDEWSVSAGIANVLSAGINARNTSSHALDHMGSAWHKSYIGSLAYTAPSSWGWAAGSSIYAGVEYGYETGSGTTGYADGNQVNYYAGTTFNTPWKQLTTGLAFDYVHNLGGGTEPGNYFDATTLGLYATFKATDKLSFNGRGEWVYADAYVSQNGNHVFYDSGLELTGTVEYDLWANVISRLELRWDHLTSKTVEFIDNSVANPHRTSVGLYANVIYKF
ncbi:MAG TPA: outer membrane beta-barrel protein [Verrucomicrobiae bacterium]|nr:outer membrane beta-barrel protein [Verrucomicrobiae bacterium]